MGPNDEVILESKQAGEWIRKDYPASKIGNEVLAGNMERIQSKPKKKRNSISPSKAFDYLRTPHSAHIRDTNKVESEVEVGR